MKIDQEVDNDRVCKCGEEGTSFHTCPFLVEIDDDNESVCNCCDECTEQCRMDI
jgi:hypothetical protein